MDSPVKASSELKNFIFLIMALLCASPLCVVKDPASAAMDGDVRIKFTFTKGETSKDSHEIAYVFEIAGGRVIYSGPYGECVRGECEYKKIVFKLTVNELDEILSLANELGFYSAFSEIRPIKHVGSWVKASLVICRGERQGAIRVEGMVKNWGRRTSPAEPEISPRAREQMKKMERFGRAVTSMAKKRYGRYL